MFSKAQAESFGRELAANPVARALALSVLLHFVLIAGVEVGRKAGLWTHSLLPQRGKSRVVEEVEKAEELLKKQIEEALRVPEAQLVFVEVDPTATVPEPPKDTKFYSSQNSIASNPDLADKNLPKIDGPQDKVVKTFDTLKPDPRPPEPKPQEAKPEQKAQPKVAESKTPPREVPPEEPKATRTLDSGETLLARAVPKAQPEQKPEPRRPRTVAEAKAQKGIIEGPKMRQAGGARRHSVGTNLDVRATPFGAYDLAFIQAVQSRWFNLMEERDFVGNQAGRVVLEFRLNYDGRITALRVVDSEVSEILSWTCQRAVLDPAPYRPFPSDMRRMVNNDYRDIRFTFYYNQ